MHGNIDLPPEASIRDLIVNVLKTPGCVIEQRKRSVICPNGSKIK